MRGARASIMHALFTGVLVACTWLTSAPIARANGCDDKDPCAFLWGAESVLSAEERGYLDRMCRAMQGKAEAAAETEWRALGDDKREWIVRRLSSWSLGAKLLSRVLPESAWRQQVDECKVQPAAPAPAAKKGKSQAAAAQASREVCALGRQLKTKDAAIEIPPALVADLMTSITSYLRDADPGTSAPIGIAQKVFNTFEAWTAFAQIFGLRPVGKRFADEQAASTVLVFVGDKDDKIFITSGHPSPGLILAPKAATASGYGVYIAVVPRGALLSINVKRGEGIFHITDVIADDAEIVQWVDRPALTCVDVAIAMEPSSTIYIDGEPLCDGADTAAKGDRVRRFRANVSRDNVHELAVIGRSMTEPGKRVLLAHREIDAANINPGYCAEVQLDLQQRNFHDAVALLGVKTGNSCPAAGADRARLHHAISAELKRRGREVKDIETWTETIQGLGSLKDALQAIGGEPIGADRGRLHALRAIGDGAAELQRQGFGKVFSASLECSRRGRDGGWEYALVGRLLDVEHLVEATRDTVTGIDLDDVVQSRIELAHERERLHATLSKLLADLFAQPYLRFDDYPREASFLDPVEVAVEARGVIEQDGRRPVVTVAARPLAAAEARRICDHVERHGALGGQSLDELRAGPWQEVTAAELTSNTDSSHYVRGADATRPGRHLLYSALLEPTADPQTPIAEDYVCVTLTERRPSLWFDLGLIADDLGERDLDSEPSGIFALLSAGPPDMDFEALLGFAQTNRELRAPPSWDQLGRPLPYDSEARLEVDVQNTYIVLGGAWRMLESLSDDRFCGLLGDWACVSGLRRMGVVLRLGAFGSLRMLSVNDVPVLRGNEVRPGLGALLELGLRYAVSDRVSIRLLVHVISPDLLDVLSAETFDETRRLREVDYDPRPIFGISLGLGLWSLPWIGEP